MDIIHSPLLQAKALFCLNHCHQKIQPTTTKKQQQTNKQKKTNNVYCLYFFVFHKCLSRLFRCCLLVPAMMAMKWSSLFIFLLVSSGCRLFSLQADSSVFSLLGLGCRQFILPHISGRSVSLFPLRCGLLANLTAPYFRQVCQLSLVHSS